MEENRIDIYRFLGEFLIAIRKFFWVPIALAVLLSGLLTLRAYVSFAPRYSATTTFTITVSGADATDISGTTNYYDKATAEQLSKTFSYLISSDLMQSRLKEALGTPRVNGSITASTVPGTNLFSVTVTGSDPEQVYDILQAVIEQYPAVANYVIGASNMNILVQPLLPTRPDNSFSALRSLARGAGLGLIVGLAFVAVMALTLQSVRSRSDIHKYLNQSCLAEIPFVSFKKRKRGSTPPAVHILNAKVSEAFQENVRSLRIKFLRKTETSGAKVLMVTSTTPGEGKTTVAVNLAMSLSQNGKRVILVDMDLRHPSVKKAAALNVQSKGIAEYLAAEGREDLREYLISVKGTELFLLAGDRSVNDPKRLLGSPQLGELIRKLGGIVDYVILDTPPVGLLADGLALSELVDGVVFVIGEGTRRSNTLNALQTLGESRISILGCVLNRARGNTGSARYGSGYGYGYGYSGGYGDYGYSSYGKKRSRKK